PFFGFLDDDDEYLPGWADVRLQAMDSGADVVVTNGFIREETDTPLVDDTEPIRSDPLGSFMRRNWFASPASLFRAETIPPETFDFRIRYLEWTCLFFVLHGKRIEFVNDLTIRKYADNADSVSKSAANHLAYPDFRADLCA